VGALNKYMHSKICNITILTVEPFIGIKQKLEAGSYKSECIRAQGYMNTAAVWML